MCVLFGKTGGPALWYDDDKNDEDDIYLFYDVCIQWQKASQVYFKIQLSDFEKRECAYYILILGYFCF